MHFTILLSALVAVALAIPSPHHPSTPYLSTPTNPPACLDQTRLSSFVSNFTSLLTGLRGSNHTTFLTTAETVLAPNFTFTSESLNTLRLAPNRTEAINAPTWTSLGQFITDNVYPAEIPGLIVKDSMCDCEKGKIVVKWTANLNIIGQVPPWQVTGPKYPVSGYLELVLAGDGKVREGGIEFNTAAWMKDLGGDCEFKGSRKRQLGAAVQGQPAPSAKICL